MDDSAGPASLLDNSAPILLRRGRPVYPEAEIRSGVSGFAVIRFDISASGLAENAEIVTASHAAFGKAALKAAARLRFQPRMVDGSAVVSRGHRLRYRFDADAL